MLLGAVVSLPATLEILIVAGGGGARNDDAGGAGAGGVVYSWTGTQWRKVGDGASVPTLQQVTTAGNSTTDSINIKTPLNKLAVSITSFDFAGAENTQGEIKLRNTFDSAYLKLNNG